MSGGAITGFLPYRAAPLYLAVLVLAALTTYNARLSNNLLVSLLWPALATGLVGAACHLLVRSLAMRSGMAPTYGTQVTSFRLVTSDGELYDCRIMGDIVDGGIRTGDTVDVRGRFGFDRALQVSRVNSAKTGATIKGGIPAIHRALVLIRLVAITFAIIGVMGTFTTALIGAAD